MMVVMTMMAAALHLLPTLPWNLGRVKFSDLPITRLRHTMGNVRAACLLLVLAVPLAASPAAPQAHPRHEDPIPAEQRLDLNHASSEALMKVPGMTRVWADRILRFRPYRTKQDLLDRGVVPDQVYDRIRDYVIVHRDKASSEP